MKVDFINAEITDFIEVSSHSIGGLDSAPKKVFFIQLVKSNSYYIISYNKSVIGSFSYIILWDDTIMIQFLRIKKNFRRKGVGKQIISFVNEIGKQKGCEDFMSTTLEKNKNSILFHENVGFQKKGYIDFKEKEIVFLKPIITSTNSV